MPHPSKETKPHGDKLRNAFERGRSQTKHSRAFHYPSIRCHGRGERCVPLPAPSCLRRSFASIRR
jgi:hypothetical protein